MKAGKGQWVLDPAEWLPAQGESTVSLHGEGMNLTLRIGYDDPAAGGERSYRELKFSHVCTYTRAAFPGVPRGDITFDQPLNGCPLGALVAYPDSDLAMAWAEHYECRRPVTHFRIIFMNSNLVIDILASKVALGEVNRGE